MELSWLEDFLTLCEAGNFSRAAAQRHVTQPAFSRRIRALEDWAGVPLFDRGTHPVALTEAGRRFQPHAEDLRRRLMLAREEVQEAGKVAEISLRFAATHVLSLTFFPAWLHSLETRLNLGPVQLISDSLQACEEVMLHGHAQFLLCHHHPDVRNRLDPNDFRSVAIDSDVLVPVAAAGPDGGPCFVLSERREDSPPILAYSLESGLGRIVRMRRSNESDPARFEPVFTSHLAVVLKTMVLDRRGIAWLPRSLIRDELADGRIVEAGAREWQIPVEIRLFRRRRPETTAAEDFWRAVRPVGD